MTWREIKAVLDTEGPVLHQVLDRGGPTPGEICDF